MAYVDGFVLAVPEEKKEAYRDMARAVAQVYRNHGALQVVECWGDDVPDGETISFRRAVKAEDGEVVLFSWIVWPSREARDTGNEAVMNDPRIQQSMTAPFDPQRMICGGFDVLLDV